MQAAAVLEREIRLDAVFVDRSAIRRSTPEIRQLLLSRCGRLILMDGEPDGEAGCFEVASVGAWRNLVYPFTEDGLIKVLSD